MHIARMLNERALHSGSLVEHVKEVGIQSFIKKFRAAMIYMALDIEKFRPCGILKQFHASGLGYGKRD